MISNENRKISFLKKIQGVKEIMEIDSFESSSSEDPHLSILKSMPLRMRTQVMLANPRRFGSGTIHKKSIAQTQNMIEEMSESES